MKLSEQKELKQAIISLSEKEKDKLLLRLVAKDKVLTEHLHFKLLEDTFDLEQRISSIKENIEFSVKEIKPLFAKEALVKFRKLIAQVNHFYKVTKNDFGEVDLRIYLLNEIPTSFKEKWSTKKDYGRLFYIYYLRATLSAYNKWAKLHEDLQFDLTEGFNQVFQKISKSEYAEEAEKLGLPKVL